jgi:alkanesulfonate monooxygenase SsuD/methylene tetrahydromethanopterin reductase-like flavin-dependent oxidoreductase (luciferase family)
MARVEFGWSLPALLRAGISRDVYMEGVKKGSELIKGHFDSLWFTDHLQYDNAPLLEGWTALTYFAAQHPEFTFGHIVLSQSFRNPALLAKMAATAQFLSGGRFILGLGAGWKEDEYRAYGYDYPSAGTRVEELAEAIQIIRAMWSEERATVNGEHYSVVDAWCEPKPDPLPTLLVGAFKPRMLRVAARYADWWNVSWTGIDTYHQYVQEFERACAGVQRDPATVRRSWYGGCACAPTEAAVKKLNTNNYTLDRAFAGTPAQVIEQMQPFVDLGVDHFMLSIGGFPDLTTLEMLVEVVLPALNGR